MFKDAKDDTEKDDEKYHHKQFDNLEFWWDDEKGQFGLSQNGKPLHDKPFYGN